MQREVGVTVRNLFNTIRRYLEGRRIAEDGLTPMQGRILGYVAHQPGDVFQRDIEREFEIRRSTASAILGVLERDGLLTREPVQSDARLKKLRLTDAALDNARRHREIMLETEAILTRGVSEAELNAFFATMEKFEANIKQTGGTNER